MRYLKYLSLVAIVGYLIALPFKIYFIISYPFIEPTDLITDILDLLAVCVPPTLPTTL
jgi:cation-transporting ATPase 13A3/4/5